MGSSPSLAARAAALTLTLWSCATSSEPPRSEEAFDVGERTVIRDTRALIAAQVAYQSYNRGYYAGRLSCLAKPADCLEGHPTVSPLLSAELVSLAPVGGFSRTFYAGPLASGEEPPEGVGPSSVSSYVYVAVPEAGSGARAFCGDSSGRICATRDGSAPVVVDGRCAMQEPAAEGTPAPGARPCEVLDADTLAGL
jgi:hypothetical protein